MGGGGNLDPCHVVRKGMSALDPTTVMSILLLPVEGKLVRHVLEKPPRRRLDHPVVKPKCYEVYPC